MNNMPVAIEAMVARDKRVAKDKATKEEVATDEEVVPKMRGNSCGEGEEEADQAP